MQALLGQKEQLILEMFRYKGKLRPFAQVGAVELRVATLGEADQVASLQGGPVGAGGKTQLGVLEQVGRRVRGVGLLH